MDAVRKIISEMSVEEKASLCSGQGVWNTQGIGRINVRSLHMSDGPHGVRIEGVKATCFPAACLTAASFDKNLMEEIGAAIGRECRSHNVDILLGPGLNIKRSPLGGRNFEYFSEDPVLSGYMAAGFVKGLQGEGVSACIKHYAANNQEYQRMVSDSIVSESALFDIYLKGFKIAVKESKPHCVMSSYNKINGKYVGEDNDLLNEVLRDKFGFDGVVISDWGSVNNRVNSLKGGLDIEMPSSSGVTDKLIIDAVNNKELPVEVLDKAAERILKLVFIHTENTRENSNCSQLNHLLAGKAASESAILLKNNGILPISKKIKKLAVIGEFAKKPRFQGGGSANINNDMLTDAYSCLEKHYGANKVVYSAGYNADSIKINQELINDAAKTAKEAETVVLFVGLPDFYESEGYDRENMRLPENHIKLIDAVIEANQNTVIALFNGGIVEMPFADKCAGLIEECTYSGFCDIIKK